MKNTNTRDDTKQMLSDSLAMNEKLEQQVQQLTQSKQSVIPIMQHLMRRTTQFIETLINVLMC